MISKKLAAQLSLILILLGCGMSQQDKDTLIHEEYNRQLALLVTQKTTLCHQQAEVKAEMIVDSLIRMMNINPLKDSLYRPHVPPKPSFVKTDSSIVNSKQTVKPLVNER